MHGGSKTASPLSTGMDESGAGSGSCFLVGDQLERK
ncbi:unnamed protein product [Brassica oleracea var. botrytis]